MTASPEIGRASRDESTSITDQTSAAADTVVIKKGGPGTDPRRLEDDLRRSESRVRELAEADARKNEFLAILGHELRNPLAPIRNALRIMKRRGMDDPDLCWARDVVDHQLRQLGQLVDDLQEISRVTSGKVRLDREPVDVATIVAFAVETSRPTIDAHRHRLSIALPPGAVLIDVDPGRMAQVLSNLLNNAAKYTEDGGQIRLSVSVERADAVFRVRDNGVGIPRRDVAPRLRHVRPGRPLAGPLAGGAGARPHAGARASPRCTGAPWRPAARGRASAASSSSGCPILTRVRPSRPRTVVAARGPGPVPRPNGSCADPMSPADADRGTVRASPSPRDASWWSTTTPPRRRAWP